MGLGWAWGGGSLELGDIMTLGAELGLHLLEMSAAQCRWPWEADAAGSTSLRSGREPATPLGFPLLPLSPRSPQPS